MGRHSDPAAGRPAGSRQRPLRLPILALVWLVGLAAGLFALLGAAARYTTCSAHATSLACRGTGTSLGVALVACVIAVVTAATVLSYGRARRAVLTIGGAAILVLVGLFLAARALLATV